MTDTLVDEIVMMPQSLSIFSYVFFSLKLLIKSCFKKGYNRSY